jgi:hypothetical protein
VKLEANTTGTNGGGIVRAILPVSTAYTVLDDFNYRDPNGMCAKVAAETGPSAPSARWLFLKATGAETQFGRTVNGWVPYNEGNSTYDVDGC